MWAHIEHIFILICTSHEHEIDTCTTPVWCASCLIVALTLRRGFSCWFSRCFCLRNGVDLDLPAFKIMSFCCNTFVPAKYQMPDGIVEQFSLWVLHHSEDSPDLHLQSINGWKTLTTEFRLQMREQKEVAGHQIWRVLRVGKESDVLEESQSLGRHMGRGIVMMNEEVPVGLSGCLCLMRSFRTFSTAR